MQHPARPEPLAEQIDDEQLVAALRAAACDVLRHRRPASILPGLMRSHRAFGPFRCRCGHTGEWAEHAASVLVSAGMVSHAF